MSIGQKNKIIQEGIHYFDKNFQNSIYIITDLS